MNCPKGRRSHTGVPRRATHLHIASPQGQSPFSILNYCFAYEKKHRFRGAFRISLEELILNAECKDDEHDNRQDIAYIEADIILNLESAAFVGLLLEVLPTPAAAGGAEQQVNQRTERQPDIGHKEVLEVEHV